MNSFEIGDGLMFFALWEDHIPAVIPKRKNLEILLAVYFAIHPILHNQVYFNFIQVERLPGTMAQFKKFLEDRRDWAQVPEFLQFYALPYLPDPSSHPSFSNLFESEWKSNLKSDVEAFLNDYIPSGPPKLLQIYERSKEMTLRPRPPSTKPPTRPPTRQDTRLAEKEDEIKKLKQDIKDSTKREHDLLAKLKLLKVLNGLS
jgi:hypothetical protein